MTLLPKILYEKQKLKMVGKGVSRVSRVSPLAKARGPTSGCGMTLT